MNPRADRKIMMKIVARAMIDSFDQDGLGLESGTTYVPVMFRFLFRVVYWSLVVKVEYIPLISDCFNIFDMITVRRPRFAVGYMDTAKVYKALGVRCDQGSDNEWLSLR
jgi:hypothetical protein